jgi:transcriptional regulator with XRE-family HTH domain
MNIVLCKILSLVWESGLGEVEFCKEVGINKSAITDWKRGKTKSYEKHIQTIANYFNLPASYFSDKFEHPLDNQTPQAYNKYDEQLLNIFRELNEEGQRAAVAHIEFLLTQGNFKKPVPDELETKEAKIRGKRNG